MPKQEVKVGVIKTSIRLTAQGSEYVLDFGDDFGVTCPFSTNFPGMLRAAAENLDETREKIPAAYLTIGSPDKEE